MLDNSSQVLFLHKFTSPNYSWILNILKHTDLTVLVAEIQMAACLVNYSVNGSAIFTIVLKVRNTQRQFIKIKIPQDNYRIIGCYLDDEPVKPASDEQLRIMMPLKKTSRKGWDN